MRSLALILFLLISTLLHAAPPVGEWNEALSMYQAGKFDQALQWMLAHPADNSAYYYNLGLLYSRSGNAGLAAGYLEKAHRLDPYDADVNHNLAIVRADLEKALGMDRLHPASTWLEKVADQVPLEELRGILGLLALILLGFWMRSYLRTRNLRAVILRPNGLLALFALATTSGLYVVERITAQSPPAMCIQAEIIRSGPGDQYLELGKLSVGTKLRLTGESREAQSAQWLQVRFSESGIGWVKNSSLLLL